MELTPPPKPRPDLSRPRPPYNNTGDTGSAAISPPQDGHGDTGADISPSLPTRLRSQVQATRPENDQEAPFGMTTPDQVTQSMRERQKGHPELWTMSMHQWTVILRHCIQHSRYRQLKAEKKYVNLYDINEHFVIPWTKTTGCGLAVLMSKENAQVADIMLSHAWGEDAEELLSAVEDHFELEGLSREKPLWFCVFSNYQPQDRFGPSLAEQLSMDPFASVVAVCARMIAVHTTKADLYGRLWCVHEVDRAVVGKVLVVAAMSQEYIQDTERRVQLFLEDGVWSKKHGSKEALEAADIKVSTVKARCANPDDERTLIRLIKQQDDGFRGLDKVISHFRKSVMPRPAVLALVRADGSFLRHAAQCMQNDLDIVLAAIGENRDALEYVGDVLLQDQSFSGKIVGDIAFGSALLRIVAKRLEAIGSFAHAQTAHTTAHVAEKYENQSAEEIVASILDIVNFNPTDVASREVSLLLQCCAHVDELDFSDKNLGDAGCEVLCKCLERNSTVTKVNLRKARLGEAAGEAIGKALESNTKLTKLDLSFNGLAAGAGVALGKALEENCTLTDLNLECNSLGEEGAIALGKALEINTTVTELNLRFNILGEAGGAALGVALERNNTLVLLNLRNNALGETGAAALGRSLERNTTLRKLDINGNNLGESGGIAFSKGVAKNKALVELDLGFNNLAEAGGIALGNALESNSTLAKVNLRFNDLGVAAGAALAKALANNGNLKAIILDENDLEAFNALKYNPVVVQHDYMDGYASRLAPLASASSLPLKTSAESFFVPRGADSKLPRTPVFTGSTSPSCVLDSHL